MAPAWAARARSRACSCCSGVRMCAERAASDIVERPSCLLETRGYRSRHAPEGAVDRAQNQKVNTALDSERQRVKTVRCQLLRAVPVRSCITCLTCVYSSNEYADMSLPYPDRLKPPCGISLRIGM